MKSQRGDSQLTFGPAEVRNSEEAQPVLRSSEDDATTPDSIHEISASLFDDACKGARLTNKEVSFLWKCSVSNVEKMRLVGTRTCPSLVQLLLLPPRFHYEFHKAMNKRYGYGRAALREVLEALGTLALVTER